MRCTHNTRMVVHDSFNDFIVITISWAIKMMIPVCCHGIPLSLSRSRWPLNDSHFKFIITFQFYAFEYFMCGIVRTLRVMCVSICVMNRPNGKHSN